MQQNQNPEHHFNDYQTHTHRRVGPVTGKHMGGISDPNMTTHMQNKKRLA